MPSLHVISYLFCHSRHCHPAHWLHVHHAPYMYMYLTVQTNHDLSNQTETCICIWLQMQVNSNAIKTIYMLMYKGLKWWMNTWASVEKAIWVFFYINPLHTCLAPKLTGYEKAFGHLRACFSFVNKCSWKKICCCTPTENYNETLLHVHTSQQFICRHDYSH